MIRPVRKDKPEGWTQSEWDEFLQAGIDLEESIRKLEKEKRIMNPWDEYNDDIRLARMPLSTQHIEVTNKLSRIVRPRPAFWVVLAMCCSTAFCLGVFIGLQYVAFFSR